MSSVADSVIIPMQDYLDLGAEFRMNIPGTIFNNWTFKMLNSDLTDNLSKKISAITKLYGRV